MKIAYERGLHELGDGLYAYLQPDGGWGWSNAGLISADGTSLLVDTLFDLNLTKAMLDAMAPITDENPIGQAFNTHGNGDHWYGNQLLPDNIPIVASAAAIEDMRAAPPAAVHILFNQLDLGPEFDAFARTNMRGFDFASVTERLPTTSFEQRHTLTVGDRAVELIELGPAHTHGDSIAHVPDASTVFTGDLLFIEGTPMMWAGPISNWTDGLRSDHRAPSTDDRPRPWPGHRRVGRARREALSGLSPRRSQSPLRRRPRRRGGRRRHRHIRFPRLGRSGAYCGQRGQPVSRIRFKPVPCSRRPSCS